MFQIDSMSRKPVYEQIINQTERLILTDILSAGMQIPSVRSVSMANSINPRTILKAYTELDNQGLIQSVPGKGYFVCNDAKENLIKKGRKKLNNFKELLSELIMTGITRDEIIDCIDQVFSKSENNQNSKTGGDTND